MADAVLTLNCGSSSIKFALFARAGQRLMWGKIRGIGTGPVLEACDHGGRPLVTPDLTLSGYDDLIVRLLGWLDGQFSEHRIAAVGHRIVHGGDRYVAPCSLDQATLQELDGLAALAPLHQPHNLAAVRAVASRHPDLLQVGCFDTAFHQTMTPTARRYGLPRRLEQAGIRRYGFHGLSYEFIAGRLRQIAPQIADGRILVAHLGSGASMCALSGGRSIDTSMGFSALDGLVMGTRCGSLDPGVMIHLMRQGYDATALEDMLYSRSGLLGVSGSSGDMRALLESADDRAAEAVELFVFRAVREAGALISSLGGLDGLVFTAGIGESSPIIRQRICEGLSWMGVAIDPAANRNNEEALHAPSSRVPVWRLSTDEEQVIARHTFALSPRRF